MRGRCLVAARNAARLVEVVASIEHMLDSQSVRAPFLDFVEVAAVGVVRVVGFFVGAVAHAVVMKTLAAGAGLLPLVCPAHPRNRRRLTPARWRRAREARSGLLDGPRRWGGEFVCSIVAHSSTRATCFTHFLDQPREVSLGPLRQFIYRVVAVVDADLI